MATSVIGKSFPFGSRGNQSTRKSERQRTAAGRSVLDEYRFSHLVRVEQKRTQRSGDPFMVALINFGDLALRDLSGGVVESVLRGLADVNSRDRHGGMASVRIGSRDTLHGNWRGRAGNG